MPLIAAFIGQLACQLDDIPQNAPRQLHTLSASNCDAINGASELTAARVPRSSPYQSRSDSIATIETSNRNTAHPTASKRSLKITARVSAIFPAAIFPAASA